MLKLHVQMHLEGSRVVKANNETALSYFRKSADKVGSDDQLIASCFSHYCISDEIRNVDFCSCFQILVLLLSSR